MRPFSRRFSMKLNTLTKVTTCEGGKAVAFSPFEELKRAVSACFLWENVFYEDGASLAQRIAALVPRCKPADVAALAVDLRTTGRIRHAPLLLVRELARYPAPPHLIRDTLFAVVQRPDELSEFLSIYWKDGKQPLTRQVKLGLALAFAKFNEYSLAKYNGGQAAIKLRDVLFMIHAKPKDEEQAALWKRLVDGTLAAPDTWEVQLSAGADKRATFERLIREGSLGYLALLRNLRKMAEVGVDEALVIHALLDGAAKSKALPFRFVAAGAAAPQWKATLSVAMQAAIKDHPRTTGKTVVLVDVSGSMDAAMSAKSDLTRLDGATALAMMLMAISPDCAVYTFSERLEKVASVQGFGLQEGILASQPHRSTYLGRAVTELNTLESYDRLIVITDEQSADAVPNPKGKGYVINVATDKNGIAQDAWTKINGFSEQVVKFIMEQECSTLS